MRSHNFPVGIDADPLKNSPFTKHYNFQAGPIPPPGSDFIITENGNFIITEDGNLIITE